MLSTIRCLTLLSLAWLAGMVCGVHVRAADEELGQRASWTSPPAPEVKAAIDAWLKEHQLDEVAQLKVEALWPPEGAGDLSQQLLDQFAATVAVVDEQARELVLLCSQQRCAPPLPEFEFLQHEETPPLVRNNLRLLYGRWLAQHQMYDEAQRQLAEIAPADVVDPAALLFYQSVAYHRLLQKEKCLASIAQLLENESTLPRRYRTVARLMEADIKPLKKDSLDEIARLMQSVHRRLKLGRAGTRVRQEEDDVIAKLDKLIEEMEKQQQQQQQSGGGGGNMRSSNPLPDSVPAGGRGAGDVDQRRLGSGSGWGNLPPRERQETLQEITKDLPAHYRQVIEEYFRKLARSRE